MPNKLAIIENVAMYSAEELVGYIRSGIVTFDELCNETEGDFSASVRRTVERMLVEAEENDWDCALRSKSIEELERYLSVYPQGRHRQEAGSLVGSLRESARLEAADYAWNAVDKNSIEDLQRFCDEYPHDSHCQEAQSRLVGLKREAFMGYGIDALAGHIVAIQADVSVHDPERATFELISDWLDRKKIGRNDLVELIGADHNVLSASVVRMLLDGRYLDYDDFEEIGIDRAFVSHLIEGARTQRFQIPERLDRINKQSTEVYFWGIPSSGKSCAVGAILSVAGSARVSKTMIKDNNCQGYNYMTRLASLFEPGGKVCTLPEGTSIYSTYEMGFDLVDKDDKEHPLTLVDLAGELVRCMYKYDAKETLSDDEVEALDTLYRVLNGNRTQNRKIHFFVLEYGAEARVYEGLSQKVYLDGALRYIEQSRIFEKDTDAIYLMITKVDKARASGKDLQEELKYYISENYGNFYNGLKKICEDFEINNGQVEVVPFSLGTVCFQDYCMFDERPASIVVRKLLDSSKGIKNGKLQKIKNIFKK